MNSCFRLTGVCLVAPLQETPRSGKSNSPNTKNHQSLNTRTVISPSKISNSFGKQVFLTIWFLQISSDEFRIKLEKIPNSTENFEFEIEVEFSLKIRIRPKSMVEFGSKLIKQFEFCRIWPQKGPKMPTKNLFKPQNAIASSENLFYLT
jgi:hypothetical protein